MNRNIRPGENKSLVVNNSWGMFHPSWDFPVGDPRNYSSNPLHPFNRIVGTLAAMGADILFAAGNCGSECPDGRCQNVTNQGIYGANSHPAVTTVVGIGVNSERVGYSNRGPGRLANRKPDITAFTHFAGSGVYTADGGTSAATPVLAGVVSAIRTQRPYVSGSPLATPAAIKTLLTSTATDIGVTGYDFTYGFGLVNGCSIVNKLFPTIAPPIRNFCDLYPFICDLLRKDRVVILDFCKTHPRACVEIERLKDRLPIDIDPEKIRGIGDISQGISEEEHLKKLEHEVSLYLQNISVTSEIETDTHRCNCGAK